MTPTEMTRFTFFVDACTLIPDEFNKLWALLDAKQEINNLSKDFIDYCKELENICYNRTTEEVYALGHYFNEHGEGTEKSVGSIIVWAESNRKSYLKKGK